MEAKLIYGLHKKSLQLFMPWIGRNPSVSFIYVAAYWNLLYVVHYATITLLFALERRTDFVATYNFISNNVNLRFVEFWPKYYMDGIEFSNTEIKYYIRIYSFFASTDKIFSIANISPGEQNRQKRPKEKYFLLSLYSTTMRNFNLNNDRVGNNLKRNSCSVLITISIHF